MLMVFPRVVGNIFKRNNAPSLPNTRARFHIPHVRFAPEMTFIIDTCHFDT